VNPYETQIQRHSSVLPLPDNTPYSPVRIVGIPVIPRNHMHVAVHDALACIPSGIKTDVVAIRRIFFINDLFCGVNEFKQGTFLFRCSIKTVLDMPEGDHQHVSF